VASVERDQAHGVEELSKGTATQEARDFTRLTREVAFTVDVSLALTEEPPNQRAHRGSR
jgi:hypothetical protein